MVVDTDEELGFGDFSAWPKIQRHKDDNIVITEKMDGTNACIILDDRGVVGVQSRKRLITTENDNYGFAGWVKRNEEELLKLGHGYHYGEWVGNGIQKNPHELDKKYFYLFNPWIPDDSLPECIRRVKVLYQGANKYEEIEKCMDKLYSDATHEGYKPEGVIVDYLLFKTKIKYTFENVKGKWNAKD